VGEFPKKPERPQEPVRSEAERLMMEKKAEERQKKLRELSLPLNLNDSLDEMEKVPAYLRRNVQLNSVTPSSESAVSRYSLGESDENNNSDIQSRDIPYLHNKPD
jgi:cell division protein FtsZ